MVFEPLQIMRHTNADGTRLRTPTVAQVSVVWGRIPSIQAWREPEEAVEGLFRNDYIAKAIEVVRLYHLDSEASA